MAVTLNVVAIDRTRRKLRVTFAITWSGNYSTNGDLLPFTTATDTTFQGYRVPRTAPETIDLTNCGPAGFGTEGVIGTTNANCKLKLFGAGSGATTPQEVAAGAVPAAVVADANNQITAVWGRGSN